MMKSYIKSETFSRACLLIPGLCGGGRRTWGEAFLTALEKRKVQPIIYTPSPVARANPITEEREVYAMLQRLPQPVVVLGWSKGARTALSLALQYPCAVSHLFLLCPDLLRGKESSVRKDLMSAPWPQWYELLLKNVLPPHRSVVVQRKIILSLSRKASSEKEAFEAEREVIAESYVQEATCAECLVPVSILCGRDDRIISPETCLRVSTCFHNCSYTVIEGGHGLVYSNPEEIVSKICSVE